MKWDQIEDKWAAMTQRIRADWKDVPQATRGPGDLRQVPPAGNRPANGPMPGNIRHIDGIQPPKA